MRVNQNLARVLCACLYKKKKKIKRLCVCPWKYNKTRNANSNFSIVTMRRVAIMFFKLGVVKNFMQKF